MSESLTFLFDEIIPDYNTWKANVQTRSFVNYENDIESAFDKWVFEIFFAQYAKHSIRYDNPYAFLYKFLNIYENKFKQFQLQNQILKDTYGLTTDDIIEVNNAVSSFANNPNFEAPTPTTWLGYISQQTVSKLSSNKLRAYIDAVKSMPSLQIQKFLRRQDGEAMGFNDLFINIIPKQKYFYDRRD